MSQPMGTASESALREAGHASPRPGRADSPGSPGRWVLAALPAGLGGAVAVLVALGTLPDPIFYIRAGLGTLALLAGLLLSGAAILYLSRRARAEKDHQHSVQQTRSEAAAERRRFLQRLDHELKNPLMAIRAALVNVLNGSATAAQREALLSVETQVVRLSRLTVDLRKLAELEMRPIEHLPVDVAGLLREAVYLAQDLAGAGERRLHLTLPQAPWPVPAIPGDRDLLLLAIYNLLDNAVKFGRPGDTVEVRASEDGTDVTIEVADTGPGIAAEDLPHLGEELYRCQDARGLPGSGLGLALVRAIVERHDGRFAIRSRAGQGTVVTVRLPLK